MRLMYSREFSRMAYPTGRLPVFGKAFIGLLLQILIFRFLFKETFLQRIDSTLTRGQVTWSKANLSCSLSLGCTFTCDWHLCGQIRKSRQKNEVKISLLLALRTWISKFKETTWISELFCTRNQWEHGVGLEQKTDRRKEKRERSLFWWPKAGAGVGVKTKGFLRGNLILSLEFLTLSCDLQNLLLLHFYKPW